MCRLESSLKFRGFCRWGGSGEGLSNVPDMARLTDSMD